MRIVIYHNPRCSKSRETLELLRARGLGPEVIEYVKNPPSVDELRRLLRLLGMKPRQLLRTREAEYQQAGLDDPTVNDDAVLRAMVRFPKLIERPIVVAGGDAPSGSKKSGNRTAERAALGRPPKNVLQILHDRD